MLVIQRIARSALVLSAMLFGFPVEEVRADAIVTNRSMKAPTIAEIFVETEAVRVELEIGFEDLEPFQNVLPAEILERLGKEAKPFPDRFGEFFLKDWVIQFDGEIAVPRLEMMEGKTRQLRDEFTGEALSMAEGEGESVLVVNLTYLITEAKPKSVTLSAPDGSAVGFVLYHQGLAVNDFRFMSGELTVDLDWGDPWYSKFGHPNFARQYDAPLQGFLYAEPFEVRKEIIARPLDLEEWIDLDLEGKETLDAADREVILAKVAAFLETRCPVTIDGEPVEGTLDRIHFVRRSLRQTSVVTPEDDPIPLLSSMVGAIIVYPTAGLPKEAAMTWDLFTERTPKMVGRATDEAGGLPITVTPEDPEFVWKNYLKNPTVPGLVEISNPPVAKSWSLPIVVILAFIPILYLARKTRAPRQRGVALVALVVLVGLSFVPVLRVKVLRPGGSPSIQSEEEAGKVVEGLLTNIYRAFDYRDESTIYDSLAQSVEGDLLSDVYLEVQQALQLENQGGARTKVKEITLEASELKSEEERGFVSRANWMVTGSVGHWGHTHQRINRYEAEVTVSPVDGHWKVTGLQLLNEERL